MRKAHLLGAYVKGGTISPNISRGNRHVKFSVPIPLLWAFQGVQRSTQQILLVPHISCPLPISASAVRDSAMEAQIHLSTFYLKCRGAGFLFWVLSSRPFISCQSLPGSCGGSLEMSGSWCAWSEAQPTEDESLWINSPVPCPLGEHYVLISEAPRGIQPLWQMAGTLIMQPYLVFFLPACLSLVSHFLSQSPEIASKINYLYLSCLRLCFQGNPNRIHRLQDPQKWVLIT